MKYSAEKMKQRLIREGKEDQITDEILGIMNKLNGKEVHKNDFKALTQDITEYGISVEGEYYSINPDDCE